MVEASPNFGGKSESLSTEVTAESAEKTLEPEVKKIEVKQNPESEEESQERREHR